jgi:uncharacterized protein YdhG (YjbR/CyaY superfamily)
VFEDKGAAAIDAYLASAGSKQRKVLEEMRKVILEVAPDARQHISYGMPAFEVGKAKVGFAAFTEHCTFFPFSGSFLDGWRDQLPGFKGTKSGIHFTPEKPLPKGVLRRMVKARLSEGGALTPAAKPAKPAKKR